MVVEIFNFERLIRSWHFILHYFKTQRFVVFHEGSICLRSDKVGSTLLECSVFAAWSQWRVHPWSNNCLAGRPGQTDQPSRRIRQTDYSPHSLLHFTNCLIIGKVRGSKKFYPEIWRKGLMFATLFSPGVGFSGCIQVHEDCNTQLSYWCGDWNSALNICFLQQDPICIFFGGSFVQLRSTPTLFCDKQGQSSEHTSFPNFAFSSSRNVESSVEINTSVGPLRNLLAIWRQFPGRMIGGADRVAGCNIPGIFTLSGVDFLSPSTWRWWEVHDQPTTHRSRWAMMAPNR